MIYTYSERTVKKYTVADAVTAARIRLDGKPLNIPVTRSDAKLTLEQVNKVADLMVAGAYNA